MEDVLDVSEEESDLASPTVCFDEKRVAPEADVRLPEPAVPGSPERSDDADERLGTAHRFFCVEPLSGWRHVEMTERRTKIDDAHGLRWLVASVSPQAESLRMVQDHLNPHTAASLSEACEPAEARRILQRVAFHWTPKQGRWLTMAEIEIAIVARGCLSRRGESRHVLQERMAA